MSSTDDTPDITGKEIHGFDAEYANLEYSVGEGTVLKIKDDPTSLLVREKATVVRLWAADIPGLARFLTDGPDNIYDLLPEYAIPVPRPSGVVFDDADKHMICGLSRDWPTVLHIPFRIVDDKLRTITPRVGFGVQAFGQRPNTSAWFALPKTSFTAEPGDIAIDLKVIDPDYTLIKAVVYLELPVGSAAYESPFYTIRPSDPALDTVAEALAEPGEEITDRETINAQFLAEAADPEGLRERQDTVSEALRGRGMLSPMGAEIAVLRNKLSDIMEIEEPLPEQVLEIQVSTGAKHTIRRVVSAQMVEHYFVVLTGGKHEYRFNPLNIVSIHLTPPKLPAKYGKSKDPE